MGLYHDLADRTAKLIAEGVIHRTDLSPVKLDIPAAPSGEEGAVVVGNATVSTQELPLPEWFSMDTVHRKRPANPC